MKSREGREPENQAERGVQPRVSVGSRQPPAPWRGAWQCPRSCSLLAGRRGHLGKWCKVLLAKSGCRVVCAAVLQGLCQGPGASTAMERKAGGGWASPKPSREQGKAMGLRRWETFRKSTWGPARYWECFRKQITKKIVNIELEKEGFFAR